MPDLKQSTSTTVRVGPVVDTAGAVVTSATLTIKLSKAGGTLANRNDATSITHDADGYYLVTLDATDTNTIGRLKVAVTGTGFIPFSETFNVLHANMYDWLYGSAAPNTTTPLDAAGIRAAVGLASDNLDTQLGGLPTSSEIATAVLGAFGVTGSVNDGSATTTSFIGDSGLSSTNDFYNGAVLAFTSGALSGIARRISDYVGSTRTFTFTEAFPAAPANTDTFVILGRID